MRGRRSPCRHKRRCRGCRTSNKRNSSWPSETSERYRRSSSKIRRERTAGASRLCISFGLPRESRLGAVLPLRHQCDLTMAQLIESQASTLRAGSSAWPSATTSRLALRNGIANGTRRALVPLLVWKTTASRRRRALTTSCAHGTWGLLRFGGAACYLHGRPLPVHFRHAVPALQWRAFRVGRTPDRPFCARLLSITRAVTLVVDVS